MRLHTNLLTTRDLYAAKAAHGMRGVDFYKLDTYGSMSRERAFEVRLESNNSNRRLNFGDGYTTAATWDEWGIFFGELFRRDPHMFAGGTSNSGWGYRGREDFRIATMRRFDRLEHKDQHKTHQWQWQNQHEFARCKNCGAGQRYKRPTVVITKDRVLRLDRRADVERFIAA